MDNSIPRPFVAKSLGVDDEALPPGDLPLARLAQRLLMFLRDTEDDGGEDTGDERFEAHPEVWTALVASALTDHDPDHALNLQAALMVAAQTPDDLTLIAQGPLCELLAAHGPALLPRIETLAQSAPRFAQCLAHLPPEAGGALFVARMQALATPPAGNDDLPPATGLV